MTGLVAAAAGLADPVAARSQMGLSLGRHIIIACFGVGLPCCFQVTPTEDERPVGALAPDGAKRSQMALALGRGS